MKNKFMSTINHFETQTVRSSLPSIKSPSFAPNNIDQRKFKDLRESNQ